MPEKLKSAIASIPAKGPMDAQRFQDRRTRLTKRKEAIQGISNRATAATAEILAELQARSSAGGGSDLDEAAMVGKVESWVETVRGWTIEEGLKAAEDYGYP